MRISNDKTSWLDCHVERFCGMAGKLFIKWPVLFLPFIREILGSVGDKSPFYNNCLRNCKSEICDSGQHFKKDYNILGFEFSLWSCLENCEYDCQWKTVEAFQRNNWAVPQFNGKWPFIRLLGFQEPASVFFSIMNFWTNLNCLLKFRETVPKSAPFFYVWNIYGLVQMNCWFWSSVYHCRDTDVSERLDYMSAFLVIVYFFYVTGLRFFSTSFNLKTVLWSIFCLFLALNHIVYLWSYAFDYGYNMNLNIILGGSTCLFWIIWSFLHYQSQPYVWKIFLFSILVIAFAMLELIDFPPLFWLLDAHALWHSSTIIATIVLFMFIIDDCNHLSRISVEKLK